jgi:transcription elongation GreA/GreB family factor
MSRAFVKELDGAEGDELPELAVSPHRNLVTAQGLAMIDANLRRLDAELSGARAKGDRGAVARAERDRRYWSARRSSAELVVPQPQAEVVRFGNGVELRTESGATLRFRIVGEDESDPASGLISWVSPLAELLLGSTAGDAIPFRGGTAEVVAID